MSTNKMQRPLHLQFKVDLTNGEIVTFPDKMSDLETKLFVSGADAVAVRGTGLDFVYEKTFDCAKLLDGRPFRLLHYGCKNYGQANRG